MDNQDYDRTYAAQQLCRSRQPLRQLLKYFYLNNILRNVRGPTIDFGCGAGQLLSRLPAGSIGLEVNPYLVEELQKQGLNVLLCDPDVDQFTLRQLPDQPYKALVMAHVLEHFTDASIALHRLLQACRLRKIERVVLVLPGIKGFNFDSTHKTLVNRGYIEDKKLLRCEGYVVSKMYYFPIDTERVGNYFTFHEFNIVYDLMK
ncbi:MAG: class I SAM-dependent methyltransferase [Deltaproteobacteria bacterium]|nr:class I SAM-dependent methyltransferase [Deltaproteobacteria bacterium]